MKMKTSFYFQLKIFFGGGARKVVTDSDKGELKNFLYVALGNHENLLKEREGQDKIVWKCSYKANGIWKFEVNCNDECSLIELYNAIERVGEENIDFKTYDLLEIGGRFNYTWKEWIPPVTATKKKRQRPKSKMVLKAMGKNKHITRSVTRMKRDVIDLTLDD